ncbi:MAG: hypothetical protein ACKPKO_65490, partial [Candidatus Fonsibacter sp.]
KEQLESIRKTDNPQPRIDQGDKVRVIFKKKFGKGYMPDWSDEVYTVESVSKRTRPSPYDAHLIASAYYRSPSDVSIEGPYQHSE